MECLDLYNTCYEMIVVKNRTKFTKPFYFYASTKYTQIYTKITQRPFTRLQKWLLFKEIFVMTFILMLFFCRKTTWKTQSATRTFSEISKITKSNYYVQITITGCSAKVSVLIYYILQIYL